MQPDRPEDSTDTSENQQPESEALLLCTEPKVQEHLVQLAEDAAGTQGG